MYSQFTSLKAGILGTKGCVNCCLKIISQHHRITIQIITNPGNKLKIDTLEKCEDVLKKLYEKVEGAPIGSGGGKGGNRGKPAGPDTPRSPSPPTPQVRASDLEGYFGSGCQNRFLRVRFVLSLIFT